MNPFAGVELAGAALLVLAGLPKVRRPGDTRRALRSVGWQVPSIMVRAGGLAEVAIGVAAVAVGGRTTAALVAASYLGFTGFVVLALRRGGSIASCGCVGKPDTPPTVGHVVLTALLAAGAAAGAVGHPRGLRGWGSVTPGQAVAMAVMTLLLTWLAWLVLAELPRLRALPSAGRG